MSANLPQLDADLIDLLVQNLSRLDESSEVDRAGVYYILSMTTTMVIPTQRRKLTRRVKQTSSKTSPHNPPSQKE